MYKPVVRFDPVPIPLLSTSPEGRKSQSKTLTSSEAVECPGCNAIKDRMRAQAHSDLCRVRIEASLRITPQGADRIDRKSEVINEALAEELQGNERGSRVTAASAPQTTASTSHELRETLILLGQNPMRRLYMKSASSAGSGSGRQHVQRSSTDVEAEAPTEVPMEMDADHEAPCPA